MKIIREVSAEASDKNKVMLMSNEFVTLTHDILINTFKVSEHISKLDATLKTSEKVKTSESTTLDHRISLETKKLTHERAMALYDIETKGMVANSRIEKLTAEYEFKRKYDLSVWQGVNDMKASPQFKDMIMKILAIREVVECHMLIFLGKQ